jgi:hypothetical protein
MVGLFVLVLVATPLLFTAWLVHRVLAHRLRVAQIQAQARCALPPAPEIESRLRTLEDIVCGLDFDLQARLGEAKEPNRAA